MATLTTRGERARRDGQAKPKAREPSSVPSEDDIRILAYRLYERRSESGVAGDATADWIEAERVLASDVPTTRAREG